MRSPAGPGPILRHVLTGSALPGCLLLACLLLACGGEGEPASPDDTPGEAPAPAEEGDGGLEVELYFPAADGRLVTVRRRLTRQEEPAEQLRQLAEAVLAGPAEGEPGARPLPAEVKLGAIYLAGGGVAYVDLRTDLGETSAGNEGENGPQADAAADPTGEAPGGVAESPPSDPPAVGSTAERQIVYSLVNTLALNLPAVERVAILWNGRQRGTFAGHLDTSRPLPPEPRLIGP